MDGHYSDLRLVPKDVVRKYYGQYIDRAFGLNGKNPALEAERGLPSKGLNFANDVVYASLVWSNPSYIPANAVQNLVMAALHQGGLPAGQPRPLRAVARAGSDATPQADAGGGGRAGDDGARLRLGAQEGNSPSSPTSQTHPSVLAP
jgi:hypothetical protein